MDPALNDAHAEIAAAARGDAASFGALVERYQEPAFRAAYLLLRDASAIGRINFPPVHRAASEWALALGCDGLPTISRAAADVELSTYKRCTDGDGEALLYIVLDGGHTWPGAAVDIPVASSA